MARPWRNDVLWFDAAIVGVFWGAEQLSAARDLFGIGSDLNSVKNMLYTNEVQIFAAILGFLIAGTAIIGASTNLNRIKIGHFSMFKVLAQAFRDSMYCTGAGLAFAFFASILDRSKDNAATAVVAVAVFLLVLVRIMRAARRLYLALLI